MIYNILDFGAVADGKAMNTAAINKAIDTCAQNGGGRVVIPAGGVFMSGTIWLKSHVELHLEHGAVLKASDNFADYNAEDAYYQNYGCEEEAWIGAHLILAIECEDVAITGSGVIDGNASFFLQNPMPRTWFDPYVWKMGFRKAHRPGQCICIVESRHVRVSDITMRDLPCWALFLFGCDYVQVRGVNVFNPPDAANTDGIDIDACRYVTVSDCLIDTGDDAIAIRNARRRLKDKTRICEYVTISNCSLASCSSLFRIGVGQGEIRHVRIAGIVAHRGAVLANFCTDYGGTSHTPIEDVNFSDISATDLSYPIHISNSTGVTVKRLTLENIRCEACAASQLQTAFPGTIQDVALKNIDIFLTPDDTELTEKHLKSRGSYLLECRGVDGLRLDNVRIHASDDILAKWQGISSIEDCTDVSVRDCRI